MTVYRCYYKSPLPSRSGANGYAESKDGLSAFKEGFWINVNEEVTKGDDAWIWIPPSAILYVIKEEV